MKFYCKLPGLFMICLCLMTISTHLFAQSDSIPVYKQHPTIPDFKLMRADSTYFQVKSRVDKKKPTVIVIFSPTCGHCQHQAEEITGHMKELKNVNFIFSTAYPVNEMKQYIDD